MRILFTFLFCALFARVLPAQLVGDANGNGTPPKALFEYPYTWEWEHGGNPIQMLKFNEDGTGHHTTWEFKWRARSALEIEIWTPQNPKDKAVLKFSADYTSYKGIDYDHSRYIVGHQITSKPADNTPAPQAQQPAQPAGGDGGGAAFGSNNQNPGSAPAQPAGPAPEVQKSASDLIAAYHNSLVFVSGKEGAGSGFIASLDGVNFLVTNAHVAAGINDAAFKTLDGTVVQGGAASVAVGHDIFCMAMPAGGKPFEVMKGVEGNAAIGDDIVVLGNAEGAGVINTITGKIVGIGPNLVEVDAPFVPGNSGSPIIHLKTGKVIGVATYTMTRQFDATTHEKIATPVIRRFGYRLDSVKKWQPVNWRAFYAQAAEMQKIETLTDDLIAFWNDLAKNNGVTQGLHTNPVIKGRIDEWLEAKSHRLSAADNNSVNANFLSFLKIACQSDVTVARQHMGYDYFQRELADQQQTRDEMSKGFEEFIKSFRD